MAVHALSTGAPLRASVVQYRLSKKSREAIEAELEMHLERASKLIARLDRDDGDCDLEDDHDREIDHEDGHDETYAMPPIYGLDQSAGPLNERQAHKAWLDEQWGARA